MRAKAFRAETRGTAAVSRNATFGSRVTFTPNRNQLCPTVRTEWRVHTEGITDPFFLQNLVIARGCFTHRLAQISRWSTAIQLIAYINLNTATLRVLSSETVSAES